MSVERASRPFEASKKMGGTPVPLGLDAGDRIVRIYQRDNHKVDRMV